MKRAAKSSQKLTDLFSACQCGSAASTDSEVESKMQTEDAVDDPVKNTPSYPDIAELSEDELKDPGIQMDILTGRWDMAHKFVFPVRSYGNQKRKLNYKVLDDQKWMRYSISTDSVYCACCTLFGAKEAKERAFSTTPVHDWKNVGNLVKRHLQDGGQHHGCSIQAQQFIYVHQRKGLNIQEQLDKQYKELVERNRTIVKSLLEIIILCGKQNIPLRGHDDGSGNFMELVNFRTKTDPVLKNHIENGPAKGKYLSPCIQNEFIEILANQIRSQIVKDCNASFGFALLADEATDVSTREQLAMAVRFAHRDTSEKVTVREEFLGFVNVDSIKGETLADALISSLKNFNIDISKMKGQGYDGASNMKGEHKGVQARIKSVLPRADYVHCFAHCLSLAIVSSSKETLVRNVLNKVQEISFAFHYSAKRLVKFEESLETVDHDLGERQKLRTLCETRWSARADALYTFKAAFSVVVDALGQLADDGDDKAASHLHGILSFDFIISLVAVEHVLQSTVALSTLLQLKALDLLKAVEETKVLISTLNAERADDNVWDALYEMATSMSSQVGIEPQMPRRAGRQRHRENYPAETPSEYYKRALYLPFVDHLLQELNYRFIVPEPKFQAQWLIPNKLHNLTPEKSEAIIAEFRPDLPGDVCTFAQNELKRWKKRWELSPEKPDDIAEVLSTTTPELYPCVYRILSILLTLPVSTASVERAFSAMRRIKTYLRSTMGHERLSGLALMHIHRDYQFDLDDAIDTFSKRAKRRLALIFQN